MVLSGSGINEENYIVNRSWIAGLIADSIGAILSVPFCPYHFVRYHFVLEPLDLLQNKNPTQLNTGVMCSHPDASATTVL